MGVAGFVSEHVVKTRLPAVIVVDSEVDSPLAAVPI